MHPSNIAHKGLWRSAWYRWEWKHMRSRLQSWRRAAQSVKVEQTVVGRARKRRRREVGHSCLLFSKAGWWYLYNFGSTGTSCTSCVRVSKKREKRLKQVKFKSGRWQSVWHHTRIGLVFKIEVNKCIGFAMWWWAWHWKDSNITQSPMKRAEENRLKGSARTKTKEWWWNIWKQVKCHITGNIQLLQGMVLSGGPTSTELSSMSWQTWIRLRMAHVCSNSQRGWANWETMVAKILDMQGSGDLKVTMWSGTGGVENGRRDKGGEGNAGNDWCGLVALKVVAEHVRSHGSI